MRSARTQRRIIVRELGIDQMTVSRAVQHTAVMSRRVRSGPHKAGDPHRNRSHEAGRVMANG